MITRLMITILALTEISKADVIINGLMKYGVTGYSAEGVSQSSSQTVKKGKHKYTTTSTSTNTLRVSEEKGFVPGLGFQVVPSDSGVCVGAGYYTDDTVEMSLGWKF